MGNSESKTGGGEDSSTVAGHQSTDVSAQTKDESSPDRSSSKSRRNRARSSNGTSPRARAGPSGGATEENGVGSLSTKITDDQIQVNLAMADLMAYLQVVANNSNHLPVTRRDDPEVDKVISTLTTEEYAKKSAAFVPADIRVIGGTFTRYGAVWDLPTSEEYNACDGAIEPGRSYGGACCNTLLKVVYDAANDTAAQAQAVSDAIFDEDEDDDESAVGGRSIKSGFSLEYGNPTAAAIPWVDLLKQMKAEFKEIGYKQVPKLTTSRKIDLSKPFSLVGETSTPSPYNKSKRRSLLIGCNYANMGDAELKASHDDIRSMKDYIVNVHNFSESPDMMTVLLDDGVHKPPTFLNIVDAFKSLSEQSQPGDAVFVQFSGHGGRVLDPKLDVDNETYDEVIVPSDYETSGLIRDTLIFKTLLAPMRFGVTVTLIIDCCDNGMVMELPYSCGPKNDRKDSSSKLSPNVDFSFVRFLKVVKTLYETSTFTQLGKTVGSALGPLPLTPVDTTRTEGDEKTREVDDQINATARDETSTLFDALVEACSPVGNRSMGEESKTFDSRHEIEEEKKMGELANKSESLFEKVLNCTLGMGPHEDDDCSDDDTFKSQDHSYNSGSYTDHESYEEHSYDDYARRSSRNSRRHRRQSNRRR